MIIGMGGVRGLGSGGGGDGTGGPQKKSAMFQLESLAMRLEHM